MKTMTRGFTLIELLIVVAIIAILAAIAVPNYMDAQTRAKMSRAQNDMRALATAIESYRVDNNSYPAATQDSYDQSGYTDSNGNSIVPGINCNDSLLRKTIPSNDNQSCWRCSFAITPGLFALTTPTAYITSYPADPFADTRGLVFGYTNTDNAGWILWSFGPDCDEHDGGEIGEGRNSRDVFNLVPCVVMNWPKSRQDYGTYSWDKNQLYRPDLSNPTTTLLTAGYTYDATNGTRSEGDLWRVRQ